MPSKHGSENRITKSSLFSSRFAEAGSLTVAAQGRTGRIGWAETKYQPKRRFQPRDEPGMLGAHDEHVSRFSLGRGPALSTNNVLRSYSAHPNSRAHLDCPSQSRAAAFGHIHSSPCASSWQGARNRVYISAFLQAS